MKIVDTHCHLNDPAFAQKIDEVIGRAKLSGVSAFIVPSYDLESLMKTEELSNRYTEIHPAFGIHPWYANDNIDITPVERYSKQNRTIAIGEIGLDFSEEIKADREAQIRLFRAQVEFAISQNLPVLIHCRKAHNEMLGILQQYQNRIRGVMHSFSGNQEMLSKFLSLGLYISFSGAVTRTHAKKYHKNAKNLPEDRILFETDAPAISTQSVRAEDVEPCHILEVIRFVASLRDVPVERLISSSTQNARELFGTSI